MTAQAGVNKKDSVPEVAFDPEAPTPTPGPTRDELRAKLLGSKVKPKFELIQLFGSEIELRQPSFGDLMKVRDIDDIATRAVEMIIQYAYVPGTSERVFEDTDRNVILGWPFGEDLVRVNTAIAKLTGVDIELAEDELSKDPLQEP